MSIEQTTQQGNPMSEKGATGRPTIFTDELASYICSRLASGDSLRAICRDDDMPVMSTVMLWLVDGKHERFSEQYAKARRIQAETLADEIFDIADDGTNDWMEKYDRDGESYYTLNGEHVQRSRLRVDTRKWYLSKVVPRFADRQHIDHSSRDGTMTPSKPSAAAERALMTKLLGDMPKAEPKTPAKKKAAPKKAK